jgi:integrase
VNGEAHFLGYFATKRERESAREATRNALRNRPGARTVESVVDEYLAEYAECRKTSSLDTAQRSLKPFRDEFGGRPIRSITRPEAKEWARAGTVSRVPIVVTLFNWAVDEEIITTNPFRGLGRRGRGRADMPPPTPREFEALLDGCDALGDYAPRMRDLLEFACFTLMRPSELYELRWTDIDFKSNQIHKDRRLYRGAVDVPKTGKKTIPLPPPARDILMRQPTRTRDDGLVFVSKGGKRLSAPTVSQYWAQVRARARLDFDLYHATKHLGVHRLYAAGVSARTIAKLAGWSEGAVDGLLRVYGHQDEAAQAEIDALYETDAHPSHDARNPA